MKARKLCSGEGDSPTGKLVTVDVKTDVKTDVNTHLLSGDQAKRGWYSFDSSD